MSDYKFSPSTKVEKFFETGNYDKALELLNDWSQFKELKPQQRDYYEFLKGLILFYQVKGEELIKWGEYILN